MLFCWCCCPTAKGSSLDVSRPKQWLSQECLGDWVLAIHDELLQLPLFRRTMRGRQVQKNPMRLQWRQSSVWLWNAKWPNRKCPRVAHHMVAAKTRITNHFSSGISMMYRCRWSTNMVTMYCRGWPTFRNAACQQHFRHQPTVKRKVERGIPNAMNSLAPEDPGSILAIVSMRIRTGWLGHANQLHIPRIAKVSDPSVVKTCKGTMIFPPHHLLFRKEATPFEQTRTRSNMEQKHISSNPRG